MILCYGQLLYTLAKLRDCVPKRGPQTDDDNFVTTKPICKILSPLERGVNSKQNPVICLPQPKVGCGTNLWKTLVQIYNRTDFSLHANEYILV